MKLTIRNLELPVATKGGYTGVVPMLCDESGKPLPNQASVTIRANMDDMVRVTVEFLAGEDLEIIKN